MSSIDRRTVLRGVAAVGVGVLAGGALAACATNQPPQPATPAPTGSPDRETLSAPNSRAVLVYFSRPGENYWHGGSRDLDIGNTQVVAQHIAERVSADVIRIEAADPYPHDYEATVERNRREQQDDARPEIAGGTPDLDGYDTILLGCPVWNSRAPMIIRTLLDATDLAGRTIYPFITYAVGEGGVFADYSDLYPQATVGTDLAIQGEYATDAAPQIDQWLADNGLAAG